MRHLLILGALTALGVSCAAAQAPTPAAPAAAPMAVADASPTPSPAAPPAPPAVAQDPVAAFIASFRIDALAAGVSASTYDREMASVVVVPTVIKRNDNQPEFARPVWGYLESAVSARRIADGKANMALRQADLDVVASKYNVNAAIIAAIWGLESSYGQIMGDFDILSALTTLAYDGRRQRFGRQQLIGALKIIDKGYATREKLVGSWAGAMGQTQFIPTTYLDYAIDEDADGRRDLWTDHADIFASTANYLARSGFDATTPWGFEVVLPIDFDYSQSGLGVKKPVVLWSSIGVMPAQGASGEKADLNTTASIIVPAGAKGPAFMVFDNFRAILRYNNSTSYALGVSLLSNELAGGSSALKQDWPRDDRPLSRTERKALQQALADRGFDPGPVDGIIGAGTKKALRTWQRSADLPADGYASHKMLEALLAG